MPNRKKVPTEKEFQETVRKNVDDKMTELREKKLHGKPEGQETERSSEHEAKP